MNEQKRTNYSELADELKGFYTLSILCDKLNISKSRALYLLHRLRKIGYVKTSYGSGGARIYYISKKNRLKRKSYTDKINEVSPIQLASWSPHYVYGREITYEEALVYAIKKRDIRYLIASLALFKKIKNWSYLYQMAKKENIVLEIVVLYEVAKRVIKRLNKMPKKYYNLAKKQISNKYSYIASNLSSDSFRDIERKWKMYIPLNYSDLAEYRGIKT